MRILPGCILLVLVLAGVARAQTDPVLEDSDIRPFTASGSIGISAQAYSASGIAARRAPLVGQTNANVNFSLFGLSSGISLLYSSDQSRLRQNMNNLSFNASWRWLTVQAGDVSPNLSQYGLNGITIRGGYLRIDPGSFYLELAGGRSRKQVSLSSQEGFRDPAYERWAMAGKIGFGRKERSHFFLSSHYSIDKSETLQNPGPAKPQENLTLTPDFKLSFLGGRLNFGSEVTVSAYTRDLNTTTIPLDETNVPGFLQNIFQPHVSTRINYAGQASADVSMDSWGLGLNYERIQPGYMSLGVSRVRDDHEQIQVSPTLSLAKGRVKFNSSLSFGRNNLLDTRLQTQRNTNVGTNLQVQLTDLIFVNASYNYFLNDVSSSGSTTQPSAAVDQQQISHNFMLQPTVSIISGTTTHTFSLTASYLTLSNSFEGGTSGTPDYNSDTYTTSLSYSLAFPSGLSLNSSGNYLVNSSARVENTTMGINAGASYAFFDRKMTVSLNTGFNQNRNESSAYQAGSPAFKTKIQQVMVNMNANYRLTGKDTFSLRVRNRNNRIVNGTGSTYTEIEGSFQYQHRF